MKDDVFYRKKALKAFQNCAGETGFLLYKKATRVQEELENDELNEVEANLVLRTIMVEFSNHVFSFCSNKAIAVDYCFAIRFLTQIVTNENEVAEYLINH